MKEEGIDITWGELGYVDFHGNMQTGSVNYTLIATKDKRARLDS